MGILQVLRSKNYRLFFAGQTFSNLGNMMKQVALGWLVYRTTDSAFLLGLVSFSREISAFIFSMFAGVIADRYNKHRLLILCQLLVTLNAFALAYFTLSEQVTIPVLIILQIFFGFINSLEMPSRQSFVNDLVEDKANLGNAIALNSSLFNTARIVGPAIAGILIPFFGEGYCFLLYAVMSLFVVITFQFIDYQSPSKPKTQLNFKSEIMEGVIYAYRTKNILFTLLFVAGITLFGLAYIVILPVFAADIFDSGPMVFGYMNSAIGVGSLLGAGYIVARNMVSGLDMIIFSGALIFGFGLAIFSLSEVLWISLIALMATGFGRVMIFAGSNTFIQIIVPEKKRGRVLSLYIMLFMGALALGSFLIGILSELTNASTTLFGSSICVIVLAIIFGKNLPAFRKRTYRILKQNGTI